MHYYRKGCRYLTILDGDVSKEKKIKAAISLSNLFSRKFALQHIVVQPRGNMKWWLFEIDAENKSKFIMASKSQDALVMLALLQ